MTREGVRLIRKVVVRYASSQNFNGIDALDKSERPTSTVWQCLRSAAHFADECVCMRHGERSLFERRKSSIFDIPPPPQISLHSKDLSI
jgi:hypothetical protein